jgi:hypothetical protein
MADIISNTRRGNPKDLTGRRFGRLTAVEPVRLHNGNRGWRCRCDCGNEIVSVTSNLGGHTDSCGCLRRELTSKRCKTHGLVKSLEYHSWSGMIARCTNPKVKCYGDYGGRGIRVCKEWMSFEAFYRDMGPRPSRLHSLDRYPDVNGDYRPGNCRWGTPRQQSNNRRSNRLIEFRGDVLTLAEMASKYNIRLSTLWARLNYGWPIERALLTPVRSLQGKQNV